jgi:hypothetical protein
MKKSIQVIIRTLAIISIVAVVGFAQSSTHTSTSNIFLMPVVDSEGNQIVGPRLIEGAHATLYTNDEGAIVWMTTSRIDEGNAVSMWWVVFNYPENCIDGCNIDDFENHAEATGASMIGSLGVVVANSDEIKFFSHIEAGDSSIADMGPGLLNPRTAEIHMVLRDHGPAIPAIVLEQVSTFMGGCDPEPPNAPCVNAQFAIFMQ